MSRHAGKECPACGDKSVELIAKFDAPPPGEKNIGIANYHRELWRCTACGHFVNRHDYNLEAIYRGLYRETAYGGANMEGRFKAIMSLPSEKSDNRQRVRRIIEYAGEEMACLLDVGSGMGVFPVAMALEGIDVVALDPDPLNIAFIVRQSGARSIVGDFMQTLIKEKFSTITLNKVIEHVPDPVAMLRRAADLLKPGGIIYVEVPDGEAALAKAGPRRQEFFLEHYAAYSPESFALTIARAGLAADLLKRLCEPSGKYTLFAFCRRK
jgi:2-polyprenyl-3-methyl-5-hydroxy-6-metoxy-1,4-benzoquinol methylase